MCSCNTHITHSTLHLKELTCVLVGSIRGCCVRWCPNGRASRLAPRGPNASGSGGCRSACQVGWCPAVPAGSRPTALADSRPSSRRGHRQGGRGSCLPLGPWSRCSWGRGSPAKAGRSLPGQPAGGDREKEMKCGGLAFAGRLLERQVRCLRAESRKNCQVRER